VQLALAPGKEADEQQSGLAGRGNASVLQQQDDDQRPVAVRVQELPQELEESLSYGPSFAGTLQHGWMSDS
jgi:hypothetical protein